MACSVDRNGGVQLLHHSHACGDGDVFSLCAWAVLFVRCSSIHVHMLPVPVSQWWFNIVVGGWLLFNILFNYFSCIFTAPVSTLCAATRPGCVVMLTCRVRCALFGVLCVNAAQGTPPEASAEESAELAQAAHGPRDGGDFSKYCKQCTCSCVPNAVWVEGPPASMLGRGVVMVRTGCCCNFQAESQSQPAATTAISARNAYLLYVIYVLGDSCVLCALRAC